MYEKNDAPIPYLEIYFFFEYKIALLSLERIMPFF